MARASWFVCALLLIPLLGCPPAVDDDDDDSGGCGSDPTWTCDIEPMLRNYCEPCHTGAALGSGGIAWLDGHENVTRAAANLGACPDGITRAECLPRRIANRQMPEGVGCVAGEPGCPTVDEFELLEAWVEAGMPE